MERGTRILVICAAVFSILAGFGFIPDILLLVSLQILPGASDVISNVGRAGNQGGISAVINTIIIVVVAFMIWCMFFLPAMIAFQSRHPRKTRICLLNVLLGVTVIGWLAAFFWAMHGKEKN
jgi:hypothetical protein